MHDAVDYANTNRVSSPIWNWAKSANLYRTGKQTLLRTNLSWSRPNLFIYGSCFLNISRLLESKVKLLALSCHSLTSFDLLSHLAN